MSNRLLEIGSDGSALPMSGTHFVVAQSGTNQSIPQDEPETSGPQNPHQALADFWPKMMRKVEALTTNQLRTEAHRNQELPLARIKKIMKLDDDVKMQMISAEAPVLFAVASEMFIQELTLRAWTHTDDNKRKTLQKNDVAMAIAKCEQFDFLIDIVPREEAKPRAAGTHPPKGESSGMEGVQVLGGIGTPQQVQVIGSTGSGDNLQYYIQMPGGGEAFQVHNGGPILQATQIGQPIRLEGEGGGGGGVQVIRMPDGAQPIQLQLLPGSDPHGHLIAQVEGSGMDDGR